MKYSEFIKMIDNGLQPVIEFTKEIEELDLDIDAGMRCKVLSCSEPSKDDITVTLKCDLNEFRKYNEPFAKANFYDKNGNPILKWFDTLQYPKDGIYNIYIDTTDEYELLFNVVEESIHYRRYIESESKLSYVNWLEKRLNICEKRLDMCENDG